MTGMGAAIVEAHRKNMRRYCQLLATELTESERDFIHRRIAETRLAIDQLELGGGNPLTDHPHAPSALAERPS
jgi:hypothetical protein